MQTVARILSAVLSVYMVILIIRVMLTWFRSQQGTQFYRYLAAITDPYLNWFKRFSFLRAGMVDFSPIAGFVILGLITNMLSNFAVVGKITLASFLSLLIYGIWSIISFILVLFIILTIVRLLSVTLFRGGFLSQISPSVDSVIEPIVLRVKKIFFRNSFVSYTSQLLMTIALLVVLNVALRFVFAFFKILVEKVPF